MGLAEALGAYAGFEFNEFVTGAKFLLIGPGGRDGVMMGLLGNFVPNVVTENFVEFFEFSSGPLVFIISQHGLGVISWFNGGDGEDNSR
jgi:hypothetical protein